jgi:hypothetical protein
MFGVLSVFGHHIKGMLRLQLEQIWTSNVTSPLPVPVPLFSFVMLLS